MNYLDSQSQLLDITSKTLFGGSVTKAMVPGTEGHRQEAISTVVGILKQADLPPVKKHE